MSVSGTNQSKNIATPYGQRKAGVYLAGSPIGLLLALTYANDVVLGTSVINQSKS